MDPVRRRDEDRHTRHAHELDRPLPGCGDLASAVVQDDERRQLAAPRGRADFPHADLVQDHCTLFNVRGNTYRLVTHIDSRSKFVFLRFFLTHAEYDTGAWNDDC
jgi:hypothetical protein